METTLIRFLSDTHIQHGFDATANPVIRQPLSVASHRCLVTGLSRGHGTRQEPSRSSHQPEHGAPGPTASPADTREVR